MVQQAPSGARDTGAGRYVLLLRAVNVGGRTLDMESFRAALAQAGCAEALTLGAAGSAVVSGGPRGGPAELERAVERTLAAAGLETAVVVRSAADWGAVIRGNPFREEARADPAHLLVCALKGDPGPEADRRLSAAISGRERVAVGGRHVYLVYPDGVGRSKLTAAVIERALGVRGTSRNWNTVERLQTVLSAEPPGRSTAP